MKKVGIIGGSGYTGGELIRLVLHHPALELDFVYSTTRPGTPMHDTHADLLARLKFLLEEEGIEKPSDQHERMMKFVEEEMGEDNQFVEKKMGKMGG